MKDQIVKKIIKDWKPDCYKMNYPVVALATNALVWRIGASGEIEVVLGRRGKNQRWSKGLPMIFFGGFVDPPDASILDGLRREIREEVGKNVKVEIPDFVFCSLGPVRFRHHWNPETHQAIRTDELANDIPVTTDFYLAKWLSGDLEDNEEVEKLQWIKLDDFINTHNDFAFDSAVALERLLKHRYEKGFRFVFE